MPPSPASGAALPAPSAVRSELPAVASSRYSRFQARERKKSGPDMGGNGKWGRVFYVRAPAQLRSGGLAWRAVTHSAARSRVRASAIIDCLPAARSMERAGNGAVGRGLLWHLVGLVWRGGVVHR